MSFIILLSFAIVWTGLAWAAATVASGNGAGGTSQDWSGWWAAHLALAILPVAGLGLLMVMPPLPGTGTIVLPADLSFLMQGSGAEGGAPVAGTASASVLPLVLKAVAIGYAMIAGLLLGRFLLGRARLWRIVSASCPVFVSGKGIPVLVTGETITPFAVTGWLRNVLPGEASAIIVPAALLDEAGEEGLAPVIAHEEAHLARRDTLVSDMFSVAAALIWVSPFIRMLVNRWRLSAELQCDLAALAGADRIARKQYGQTLLSAFRLANHVSDADKKSAGRALPCPPAAFSTSQLKDEKMRMTYIMRGGAAARKGLGASVRLAGVAGALAMAGTVSMLALAGTVNAASNGAIIVDGRITSIFDAERDIPSLGIKDRHRGVDVSAPMGAPVLAPAEGWVLDVTEAYRGYPAYGKVVVLQTAGGVTTAFAHLGEFAVEKGQTVTAGQKIAEIGLSGKTTGPHVHIETYIDGELVDPATVWADLAKSR